MSTTDRCGSVVSWGPFSEIYTFISERTPNLPGKYIPGSIVTAIPGIKFRVSFVSQPSRFTALPCASLPRLWPRRT